MDYALAKELKDSGFPHKWSKDFENTEVIHDHPENCRCLPSLEELIEECGANFESLTFFPYEDYAGENWRASSRGALEGTSTTPIEAVAKLWLAMNRK